jgi:uncharacterized protein YjbI with pentapeptide repeats
MAGWVRGRATAQRVEQLRLFSASALVLLAGLGITAGAWIGLTRLLNHHWPWYRHLAHGQNPTSTLDITKVAFSVVAGVGAAIALTIAYRRQRDLERGRFDERFAAAASQLGANSAAQRLAGVYAMGALADENTARRQQCIDLLCAYIRLPYDPSAGLLRTVVSEHTWPVGAATGKEQRTFERLPNDRDVRLAIISLITFHLRPRAKVSWDRYDFNFTGAVFDGGDFSGAVFSRCAVSFAGVAFSGGSVRFDGAEFSGGSVSFDGAEFSGDIRFHGAEFSGGQVSFTDAEFSGGLVVFAGAQFSGGLVVFAGAQFSGGQVVFAGAQFSGGHVVFDAAQFSGGEISFAQATFSAGPVSFAATQFSGGEVNFDSSEFSGGQVAFSWAQFSGGQVSFYEAKFSAGLVVFDGAEFSGGEVHFDALEFSGGEVKKDGEDFRGWSLPVA